MWSSFFIYAVFNLIMFGCVLFSYGFFIEAKTNPDSKKFHLFGSLFSLLLYLTAIYFLFSQPKIIFPQLILTFLLIIDITVNNYKILKFFGRFVDMLNNTIEVTLPRLLGNIFLYSTIILTFFAVIFLIIKLVKYFWYY